MENLRQYIKDFLNEKLLQTVPLEHRDTIENIQLSRDAMENILFDCMEFVSEKVEQEIISMVEKEKEKFIH